MMCMLTYLPPNVAPDIDGLLNGAVVNKDGSGYAIVTSTGIIVRRSMDGLDLIDRFAKERERFPYGPALFHSRWATHGTVTVDNCHPFTMASDGKTVIAHNGVLPGLFIPRKGDKRSDTRYAAEVVIPKKFGSLRSRRNRERLTTAIGPSNKIVILTVNRMYRQSSYIVNQSAGVWDSGVWYSNYDYLPRESYMYGYDARFDYPMTWEVCGTAPDDMGHGQTCERCNSPVSVSDDFCSICGVCVECGMNGPICLCYSRYTKGARVTE